MNDGIVAGLASCNEGAVGVLGSNHSVILSPDGSAAIGRIQVCNNVNRNHRLKGIRAWGDTIDYDGSISSVSGMAEEELQNCESWDQSVMCPINQLATGLIVHTTETTGQREQITGLQLICRRVDSPDS